MRISCISSSACLSLFFLLSLCLQAQPIQDVRFSSKSNLELYVANNGSLAFDIRSNTAGLFYPRASPKKHEYIFGSGLCFGARKKQSGGDMRDMCLWGYSLRTATSCFTPGSVRDGDTAFSAYSKQYGVYVSTDYNADGASSDTRRWAIWDNALIDSAVLGWGGYWGNFVYEAEKRTKQFSHRPAYMSDEDFVTIFKDTDLNFYEETGSSIAKQRGYPLGIEVLQRVFTWQSPELSSTALIVWELRNVSGDTLRDCWLGYVADTDILKAPYSEKAVANDFTDFVRLPSTHGMRYVWTATDAGEDPATAGVLGISLLETPAVNAQGVGIIHYSLEQQRGTTTSQSGSISTAPASDTELYAALSKGNISNDNPGPADVNTLTATGPFHFAPNSLLRFAVCLSIGGLSKDVKRGDTTTLAALITPLRAAFQRYYGVLKTTAVQDATVGEETLSLSPNPATERVDLRIVLAAESNLQLRLYNSLGQELRTAEFALPAGEQQLHLDCSDVPSGNYTLLLSNKGHQYTRNFVVLH